MEAKLEQPVIFPVGTAIKLVIGTFLTVIGILLTLENLDLLNTLPVLRYWPLVLVVIGLLKFVARSGSVFGIVLMIAGAWMTAFNLDWIHFTIFELWPLLLILAGVVMVRRAFGWSARRSAISGGGTWAILSSRNIVETSRDFTGGEAFAFMGGCQIDLTGAAMTRRPAVIDATAIWGGIDILVPEDWEVVGEVVPIMGGFEMKSESNVSRSGGQLVVRGLALMGGIEVKSVRRAS